jgi:hypothetical protein
VAAPTDIVGSLLRSARALPGLCVGLLASAGALAGEKEPACEPPKPDALVRIRFVNSFGVEDLVQHAARSSCVEYRFDPPLARRMVPGPLDIQVRGADLDAIYAILFRTMNIGVEGRGKTRKLIATGPEPAESLAVPRIDQEITKIDDGHARITRRGLDEVLGSMGMLSRSVRIVPEIKNGKPTGFRLFSIRPQTVFDLVGFRNGDVVQSMNDIPMATPEKALEAYTKVKTVNKVRFGLMRNGAPFVLEVEVLPARPPVPPRPKD